MKLRWGRVVTGAIIAELVPIVLLVALVALFGPPDQAEAQAYAACLGHWIGPIAGAVMCFTAAWWLTRRSQSFGLQHGLALGVLSALIDVSLLVASDAPFEWLFAVSNVGRVLAGTLGGVVGAPPSLAGA